MGPVGIITPGAEFDVRVNALLVLFLFVCRYYFAHARMARLVAISVSMFLCLSLCSLISKTRCLTLLEILENYWNYFFLLEILEIYWKFAEIYKVS